SIFCNVCGTKVFIPKAEESGNEQDSASFINSNESVFEEPEESGNTATETQAEQASDNLEQSVGFADLAEDLPAYKPEENTVLNDPEQQPKTEVHTDSMLSSEPADMILKEITSKKPRSKGTRVAIKICSVLIAVIIGLLVLLLNIQLFITFGVTEENITYAINNIDYNNLKANDIIDVDVLSEQYETEIPEDATLAQAIYRCIDQDQLVNPITQEEVDLLVKRLQFEDFIAEKTAKALQIAKDGGTEEPITAGELVDFIRDDKNRNTIERTIGIEILDIDLDYMEKYINENNSDYLNALTTENLEENIGTLNLGFLKFFNSIWYIVVSAFLILGFAAIIWLINKKISSGLLYTGVSLAAAGLLPVLFGLLYKVLLPSDFYADLVSPFIFTLILIGAVTIIVGALFISAAIIINAVLKRKKALIVPVQ
ncbi:MAG TPA: hypothetical protein DD733_02995, partial [Clostridiales bacterium]|nr:hypothetical protein [Clostridiales bacterium]